MLISFCLAQAGAGKAKSSRNLGNLNPVTSRHHPGLELLQGGILLLEISLLVWPLARLVILMVKVTENLKAPQALCKSLVNY